MVLCMSFRWEGRGWKGTTIYSWLYTICWLWSRYHCPYFTDEETKVQRCELHKVTRWQSWGLDVGMSDSEFVPFLLHLTYFLVSWMIPLQMSYPSWLVRTSGVCSPVQHLLGEIWKAYVKCALSEIIRGGVRRWKVQFRLPHMLFCWN